MSPALVGSLKPTDPGDKAGSHRQAVLKEATPKQAARNSKLTEKGILTVKVASSGLEAAARGFSASSAWTLPARMAAAETATAALNFMAEMCVTRQQEQKVEEGESLVVKTKG